MTQVVRHDGRDWLWDDASRSWVAIVMQRAEAAFGVEGENVALDFGLLKSVE